jgi:hypothetical protein
MQEMPEDNQMIPEDDFLFFVLIYPTILSQILRSCLNYPVILPSLPTSSEPLQTSNSVFS